jgi:alkaline phosphatase D
VPSLTRRDALRVGVLGLGGLALGCAEEAGSAAFRHGVASADPRPDRVLLWTRVADATGDVPLRVELGVDPELREVVSMGEVLAREADGHAVEVEVTGLEPGRPYFYRFAADESHSALGRTRTAPLDGPVQLAFTCCASYAHGWFHAYRRIAERAELDAVVHLGDYVYEHADGAYGNLRGYDPPHETVTLDDYRRRYAWYRLDPDVAALHREHPVIATWDDHELANNAWRGGALEHDPATEGPWRARLDAARRAHREWLPRSEPVPGSLYRRLSFGALADLFVLDTRLEGRDPPPVDDAEARAPGRSILGAAQRERLLNDLSASRARWKVVALGVQLAPHHEAFWNHDAFDGYADERDRILRHLAEEALEGVIFVCGDGHKSFADDLPLDPFDPAAYDPASGAGSVAVEVMTPAASSPNLFGAEARALEARVRETSPHTHFVDAESRGYWTLALEDARAELTLRLVDGIERPDGGAERVAARFEVRAEERFLRRRG